MWTDNSWDIRKYVGRHVNEQTEGPQRVSVTKPVSKRAGSQDYHNRGIKGTITTEVYEVRVSLSGPTPIISERTRS